MNDLFNEYMSSGLSGTLMGKCIYPSSSATEANAKQEDFYAKAAREAIEKHYRDNMYYHQYNTQPNWIYDQKTTTKGIDYAEINDLLKGSKLKSDIVLTKSDGKQVKVKAEEIELLGTLLEVIDDLDDDNELKKLFKAKLAFRELTRED